MSPHEVGRCDGLSCAISARGATFSQDQRLARPDAFRLVVTKRSDVSLDKRSREDLAFSNSSKDAGAGGGMKKLLAASMLVVAASSVVISERTPPQRRTRPSRPARHLA